MYLRSHKKMEYLTLLKVSINIRYSDFYLTMKIEIIFTEQSSQMLKLKKYDVPIYVYYKYCIFLVVFYDLIFFNFFGI